MEIWVRAQLECGIGIVELCYRSNETLTVNSDRTDTHRRPIGSAVEGRAKNSDKREIASHALNTQTSLLFPLRTMENEELTVNCHNSALSTVHDVASCPLAKQKYTIQYCKRINPRSSGFLIRH